jgi:hypothetical protein
VTLRRKDVSWRDSIGGLDVFSLGVLSVALLVSRVAIIVSLVFVVLFDRRDDVLFLLDLFLLDLIEIDEWFVDVLAESLVDIGSDGADYWTVDDRGKRVVLWFGR